MKNIDLTDLQVLMKYGTLSRGNNFQNVRMRSGKQKRFSLRCSRFFDTSKLDDSLEPLDEDDFIAGLVSIISIFDQITS